MSQHTSSFCADLHCHSTVSDGLLAPDVVARRAKERGVSLWSLTDHDELGGQVLAQQTAKEIGLDYLCGVEISVTWAGKTVHIVGLGVDPENTSLTEGLRITRSGRSDRARRIGDRLAELGMPGAFEGASKLAGNPELISRTHFGRYLHQANFCPNVQTAFDLYLHDGGPAHEPMRWAALDQAISWINHAGGAAVIAHPGRYEFTQTQFDAFFAAFKDLGGKGIEVITGSHHPGQYQTYAGVAREYGFLASCGSDFHGPGEGRYDLGSLPPLPNDLIPVWKTLI